MKFKSFVTLQLKRSAARMHLTNTTLPNACMPAILTS